MLADPDSLRCVELAATHLNFREAAARVGLSAAAFSDRIRRVEEDLGVRLFERTTRSVRLTAVGNRLLPQVRVCLEDLRALERLAHAQAGPEPWSVTVGTRWELGMSWIVPALGALREARPERTVNLVFGDSPELVAGLRRGHPDVVITSYRVTQADLVAAPLHEETYVFVAAPDLLARIPMRGAVDARAHVLLDTLPDLPLFRYLLDAVGGGEVWSFAGTELLGAIGAVRTRALAGAGVAVLPEYFVAEDLARGTLVRLLPDVTLPADQFRLWWRRGHPHADGLRGLADELRARPLQ